MVMMKYDLQKNILLFCLAICVGCGGGVSGTGGIAGDLVTDRKLADLSSGEKLGLCDRVANAGSEAVFRNKTQVTASILQALYNRYRDADDQLKPAFSEATPESIQRECEGYTHEVMTTDAAISICVDSSQPNVSVGFDPKDNPVLALAPSIGYCDLDSPEFTESNTTVGSLSNCLEQYFSVLYPASNVRPDCPNLYGAIKDGGRRLPAVAGQSTENQAQYDSFVAQCRDILKPMDNMFIPLACKQMIVGDPFSDTIVDQDFILIDFSSGV